MATGGYGSGQKDRQESPTDMVSKTKSGANPVDGLKGKATERANINLLWGGPTTDVLLLVRDQLYRYGLKPRE